ncbi:UNVERIFIED_CONTAM: hypothetical protein H355_016505 [Colinus virginianus]|nr:hypothetical protein H355_016505 [Colinus virginianus]
MLLLLLPLLALAEAWMHPFHFPWRLHVEQQYEAVVHTPAGSRLALLAVFSLLLTDGHAQVFLLQRPPTVTRKRFRTADIECNVQGIGNVQNTFIHWYRQLPDGAPERILYVIGVSQIYYDSDSYKNKYSSYKTENKICVLSILNIRYNDEGTYYCAYWEYHRGSSMQAACSVSRLQPEQHSSFQDREAQGIDNFQGAYIHWYRHLPDRAPERILYVTGVSQMYYDSDSYKNKYSSSKLGNKICILSILNIHDDDEGMYYCAYWVYHRGCSMHAACTESRLQPSK